MKLSEGKLFTIESLNRVDGFEWPDGFKFAYMNTESNNHHHQPVFFCQSMPDRVTGGFDCKHGEEIRIKVRHSHIDFADSLISKEEFESVDGWVRNDGRIPSISGGFDLMLDDGHIFKSDYVTLDWDWSLSCEAGETITQWRYHKPQNQVEQPTPQPTNSIESLIIQHKSARLSTLEARRLLERAEAIEHSLLLSIEEWAESQGFDIRLLDESEEKPELVITDWRDLQKGDVVRWNVPSGNCDYTIDEIFRDSSGGDPCASIMSKNGSKFTAYPDEIKFIRRPAK